MRQLDLLEVEREERLEAGYRLSSSEDEEDDTEDNSTDENPTDDLSAIDSKFIYFIHFPSEYILATHVYSE